MCKTAQPVSDCNSFTPIAYSQSWEDPDTVREALRVTLDDDVLAITSGGCNVLALLIDQPRSITAIDINPSQNHLLELKLEALMTFCYDDVMAFVGARQSSSRLNLYQRVQERLSDGARKYWDQHLDDIEQGMIHAGRFEHYLTLFRRLILPLIHSKEKVEEALKFKTPDEQRRFYDHKWDTRRWRALFHLFFSKWLLSRLGRYPDAFRYAELPAVSTQYLERTQHAMKEIPLEKNYFIQYILTGRYRTALPPYLNPINFEPLKTQRSRVRIITTDILGFLKSAPPESFSKFYLSDVFELFSEKQYETALNDIIRAAKPNARLCYYNNLVPRSHPATLDSKICSEDDLSRYLHWKDRSFVYRSVIVERVIK